MKKHALVTGSGGFAGRHFVRALEARGWEVLGVDPTDARATGATAQSFFRNDDRSFDLVVHCAAVVEGRARIDGAPLGLVENLEIDATFFRWMRRTQPHRSVYVSSSAAYPLEYQTRHSPRALREEMIDPEISGYAVGVPDQLYGWVKLTGENLAYRAQQEGLNVTVIRPFSGYGEDQSPAYPFRAFVDRARGKEDPFQIWGSMSQVRDFIHIDDIVDATLFMTENDIDGPVNLGTGRGTSMQALATMLIIEAGYNPVIDVVRAAPMGVEYRVADVTELNKFYAPKVSLEEGVWRALR